ncbi:dual oxidase-like [Polistes fuscatus]|uniref:dual oxidase-like n=1 Tax=Polistes fuscatus TaxID=30207 RepID=UPI001CA7F806|nr:dual oxidase-like [Polistes fuscatus]
MKKPDLRENKENLIQWLLTGYSNPKKHKLPIKYRDPGSIEYPGYDGWYNNIGRPEVGAVDTQLLRRLPAAYKDGVYKPDLKSRPNPLDISRELLSGEIGSESVRKRNVLQVFFGQQVVEEILDAQRPACPPEYINIEMTKPEGKIKQMPVLRTRYDQSTGTSPNNPRQQLNEITPYIDGGLIYGTSKAWSNMLRTYANGTFDTNGLLATSKDSYQYPEINTIRLPMANPPPPIRHDKYVSRHYTENVNRYFKLGNPRGNENPFLLTFGIIWFRWHNYIARFIKSQHKNWTTEKIYNEARKWVIATQQHIITNEWIKEWLGKKLPPYERYDPNIDPQIDQFFQAAAFRYGHTLVPAGVYLRNYARNECKLELNARAIRTCNNYWMPKNSLFQNETKLNIRLNIEQLIMGMAVQLSEKEDHKIIEDLRGHLFGPLEFSRRDLMALNIQRGRDHGLPDYNTARVEYNLTKIKDMEHFKNLTLHKINPQITKLFKLYNNSVDNIDVWVGGILETRDNPGELFQKIITDQFVRIRAGDRFWYKNKKNGLFTQEEIDRLENLSFYDILISITDMNYDDIPQNPFLIPADDNDISKICKDVLRNDCCNLIKKNNNDTENKCYCAPSVNVTNVEKCTSLKTYDYFNNSEISFVLTFTGLTGIFFGIVIFLLYKLHFKQKEQINYQSKCRITFLARESKKLICTATEWQGRGLEQKLVFVIFDRENMLLELQNVVGKITRLIDFTNDNVVNIFVSSDSNYIMIKVQHNYDLVLKFDSLDSKTSFLKAFEEFISDISIKTLNKTTNINSTEMLKKATTKKDRQDKIEKFFRVVFAQAFHIVHTEDEILQIGSNIAKEVIYTELAITEFAESLSMRPDAEFIKKIFNLVDKDKNGFISFREFVDMLVIFLKGSAEEKMKFMFDMYDINGTGRLTKEDFMIMLKSFLETVNTDVTHDELENLLHSMMNQVNLASKETINLMDFKYLLREFNDKLNYIELEFNVNSDGKTRRLHAGMGTVKSSFVGEVQKTVDSLYTDLDDLKSRVEGKITKKNMDWNKEKETIDNQKIVDDTNEYKNIYWYPMMKSLANKQLQIFWMSLYTEILLLIFIERAYHYSIEREHTGLRQILGYGLALTRGAASAIMFTYSSLLIMTCHNINTLLRDTILQYYIPFDSMIDMHKYIAYWALIFTVLHVIGHGFNFYHISTQTADDLTCLFPNYFHSTDELPKFHYWMFQTLTGITGVLLTIQTGIIFFFSLPIVRRRLYSYFSFTHSLYPVFYILMILHGTGRLVQEPYFHYFFLGPAILFVLDKILTMTRKTIEIPILKAGILPSGVTCITFAKPQNFQYKCGQWIRIACPALGTNEFHPFTLSSAPHEHNLMTHIRAVGPWTKNIRSQLQFSMSINKTLPKIHIDGPYGEAHQDWNNYHIAIMVGAGIGVTPFASILKDIVFKFNHNYALGCKKVYFIWITRTQKQFEWMVDILRELEKSDINNSVSVHIFITQFYQKFDLRTILLYICERHFQRIYNKSLFTGLMAITHFGRPKFSQFFQLIQKLHPNVNKIGVFSCGSRSIVHSIDNACNELNLKECNTLFQHKYKSF